jgi:hypothetical protein
VEKPYHFVTSEGDDGPGWCIWRRNPQTGAFTREIAGFTDVVLAWDVARSLNEGPAKCTS